MEKSFVTTSSPKEQKRLATIDIIRIFLTLTILALHSGNAILMADATQPPINGQCMGGYLACEAFYMISGFFLAKTAYKSDAPKTGPYIFRKLWNYVPALLIAVLLAFIPSCVVCIMYMTPDFWPMLYVLAPTWFMWFMFLSGLVLYPLLKKWKDKVSIIGVILAFGMFVALYFMNGQVNYNVQGGDPFWKLGIYGFFTSFFRSTGGMLFGAFMHTCYLKFKDKYIPMGIRIALTVIGFAAAFTSYWFTYAAPCTVWDFMVVGMYFVFFYIVLTNIGALARKITLPNKICNGISKWSLYAYTGQYVIVGFMAVINKNDGVLNGALGNGGLLDFPSWWVVHFIVCMSAGIGMGFGLGALHKIVKDKLLIKCKKLNSI